MLQNEAITWFLVSDVPDFRMSINDLIVLLMNLGNLIVVLLNNFTATATN